MELDNFKSLYRGQKKSFKLPVGPFKHAVHDTTGAKMNISSATPQGTVSISINIPNIYENMCGWFWDIHEELNNFGFMDTTGNKMWVVLSKKILTCYDNPYDGVVRKVIDCHHITDIVETICDKLEIKVQFLFHFIFIIDYDLTFSPK